jgi:hypothetical protein
MLETSFSRAYEALSHDRNAPVSGNNAIQFEWQPDGALRTWQRRSAVVRHPLTGQRC